MKQKNIYEIIKCNNIIYKLIEQQINYPVNIAYKLCKLKKELDEIELLMDERWILLFGKDYNIEDFTEDEIILYNTTLSAIMDIDTFQLSIEEITNNSNVKLTISEIEYMTDFLK